MIRIRFLTMLAYRLNYFSGVLTYIVWSLPTPVLGLAAFGVAVAIWRAGIRRYHGAGS